MVNALAFSHSLEADGLMSSLSQRDVHARDVESSSAGEVGSSETSRDFFLDSFLSTIMLCSNEDGAEVQRGRGLGGDEGQINYQIKLTARWLWWKVQKLGCFVSLGVSGLCLYGGVGGLCLYGLGGLFFWGKALVESNFVLHPPTYVSTVAYFLVINRLVTGWFLIQSFLSEATVNLVTLTLFAIVGGAALDTSFIYQVGHVFVYALSVLLGAKVLIEGRLLFTQRSLFIQRLIYFCQGFSYIPVLVLSWPLLTKIVIILFIFLVYTLLAIMIVSNISLGKCIVLWLLLEYFFSSWVQFVCNIFSVFVAVSLALGIARRVFFVTRPLLEEFQVALRWMGASI